MTASEQIDRQIAELDDWRGKEAQRLRKLIGSAHPELAEDWKWGSAVWTSNGNVCSLGVFKGHLKVTFFKGAHLGDATLFNAGLDSKDMRSIDIHEGDKVNDAALKKLVRAAVELNAAPKKKR